MTWIGLLTFHHLLQFESAIRLWNSPHYHLALRLSWSLHGLCVSKSNSLSSTKQIPFILRILTSPHFLSSDWLCLHLKICLFDSSSLPLLFSNCWNPSWHVCGNINENFTQICNSLFPNFEILLGQAGLFSCMISYSLQLEKRVQKSAVSPVFCLRVWQPRILLQPGIQKLTLLLSKSRR